VLLGSVAETVVRTAPCPVLTIRPHSSEHNDRSAA
jgi:nucleotide-binding universal stress UspA family protein